MFTLCSLHINTLSVKNRQKFANNFQVCGILFTFFMVSLSCRKFCLTVVKFIKLFAFYDLSFSTWFNEFLILWSKSYFSVIFLKRLYFSYCDLHCTWNLFCCSVLFCCVSIWKVSCPCSIYWIVRPFSVYL